MRPIPHDLVARVLQRAVRRALEQLSEIQESIVLADLREGGSEDSEALAALLGTEPDVIERERRRAREAVLDEVSPVMEERSWAGLLEALEGAARASLPARIGARPRLGPIREAFFALTFLAPVAVAGLGEEREHRKCMGIFTVSEVGVRQPLAPPASEALSIFQTDGTRGGPSGRSGDIRRPGERREGDERELARPDGG